VKNALLAATSNVTINGAGSGSPNKLLNISTLSPVTTQVSPDEYDDIAIRGYDDDIDGDAVSLVNGTSQTHNFHDSGDQDWTMVWSSAVNEVNVSTQMVGNNSDTTLEVYKVTDIIVNPNFPNQNRFIINSKQLVGSDNSIGNSSFTFNSEVNFLYVMKVTSRTGDFGMNTDYNISLTNSPIVEDAYDNISIRGYDDDIDGDAESLLNGVPQIHNFHDSGDQDWTMVWSSNVDVINVSTQMIGNNSDTTLEIYKVTDIIVNPNFPNQNRFIINSKQLVGSDSSVGNSSVTFNAEANFLYVMRVVSRTNSFGNDTDYQIELTRP
jgi:hypothetical protein